MKNKMEVMNIKGSLSLPIKILTIMLTTVILYWQDLIIIFNEALHSDLSSHILIIPFLLIYILFRLRKVFFANISTQLITPKHSSTIITKELTGTLLCFIAYLIKLYGSYTFHPIEYHIASLPIFVAGLILIIFNPQTLRTLLFPIAFLLFLAPPPVIQAQIVGSVLASFSSQAAYTILKTLGLPVTLSNTYLSPVIYLKTASGTLIPFAIDLACSGLYSLIGFIIFIVFTAYIVREPLVKKLIVFLIGLPLIYTLNVLRIILIIVIGHISGPNLALNIFHLMGGWTLLFIGTIILLTISDKVLNLNISGMIFETCNHYYMNENDDHCMGCGKLVKIKADKLSVRDATKIILIMTITISLLFIQVPVFSLSEGVVEVFVKQSAGHTTSNILPQIEGYDGRFVYRDLEFEKISGQNASLFFQYLPKTLDEPIWIGIEVADTKGKLHPWEVCLITSLGNQGREAQVTQLDLHDIHLFDNPPISARYFTFKRKDSNETQVILYWYTRSIFKTTESYTETWSKISVIKFTNNPEEYEPIKEELLPVAKAIASYWQPIVIWSWVSLAIVKNGPTMISIIAALLTVIITASLNFNSKNKNAKHIYSQISDPKDRIIINSINALEKETVTETKIALKYKEITGKYIDPEKLFNKLKEAEQANIIKRKINNINDKPYLTWKLNFKL